MRQPLKRMHIYEDLKRSISAGVYHQGAFLPNELILAEKYGVARETLRSVLKLLEEDMLIERIRSRGTRVCGSIQAPLTFLSPCPDFFYGNARSPGMIKSLQILNGLSRVAYEHGYRLETTPISPTNSPDNIDWRGLEHINSNSRVVVFSTWGKKVFAFLRERACRVALCIGETEYNQYHDAAWRKWFVQVENNTQLIEEAVDILHAKGYRKIGLAYWENLLLPGHPVLAGFRRSLKRHRADDTLFRPFKSGTNDDIRRQMMQFYDDARFDALILAPLLTEHPRFDLHFNRNYGLPESVRLLTLLDTEDNRNSFPPISSMTYPMEEIGRRAAERLLAPEWRTKTIFVDALFINHEVQS